MFVGLPLSEFGRIQAALDELSKKVVALPDGHKGPVEADLDALRSAIETLVQINLAEKGPDLEQTQALLIERNRELEIAQTELVQERSRLQTIMEALPVGLAIYDNRGGVVTANRQFEEVWGSPRPQADSVDDYEAYKAWWAETGVPVQVQEWAAARAIQHGETVTGQYICIQKFDGATGYVLNSGAPIRDPQGEIIGAVVAIMDITNRVKAENDLRESDRILRETEERFRVALTSLPITVYTLDRDLRYTWVYDPRLGFADQNSLFRSDDEIVPGGVSPEFIRVKQSVIESGKGVQCEIQAEVDGQTRYFVVTLEPVHDQAGSGQVTGIIGATVDITEQRCLENEHAMAVSQMEMQRRLMELREHERQRIARDIHDGPLQTLASLGFDLKCIKDSLTDPALQQDLQDMAHKIKTTIGELREVTNELRPPAVMRFGLSKAVKIHVHDLQERYPETHFKIDLADDTGLLKEKTSLTLYRIYQECLNNALHHAGATTVKVSYRIEDNQFCLDVQDDGSGFPVPAEFSSLTEDGHFGLIGIQERVHTIGGTLSIQSSQGKGTTVSVRGPLSAENARRGLPE